ncbi:hypothetical protein BJ170DRAFT_411186 [Xylariales sp. AK1849]|nr:hypothetical protein BJ170DRAFT_411186 [Xylariales sp. AK1849]
MKGSPVDQLVYEYMFPKPRATDPQNFHSLLHRHLILEVRQEVHSFYGHLDTQEAKYPGLDYCHRIHRIRLGRWPWHRRLFRAFDGLRLTHSEISNLTKWEGTKWAKERFERDSGVVISDTASDEVGEWIEPEDRLRLRRVTPRVEVQDQEEEEEEVEEDQEAADEDMNGGEESDGELESIGIALNEHLRERAARREAGETTAVLDDEWEQWLKNAMESGHIPFPHEVSDELLRHSTDSSALVIAQALFPPHLLGAARAGQWEEVPESLHDILRRTLETERSPANDHNDSPAPEATSSRSARDYLNTSSSWRRTYSDLRLPVGDGGTNTNSESLRYHRTAQPGA